ncbi:hypothetical protein HYU94_03225 [Candidatus Daviesbacteria bacterium]|nr:hypothetical protein [Candidatus Daviesbacteria bacterium]
MSEIVFNSPKPEVENFQTTLATLNQQVIILREALQERDQEIAKLKENTSQVSPGSWEVKKDETLTIVGAFIKLYQYVFLPGKAV